MSDDNIIKGAIKGIFEGGVEMVKDSAKQVADTVSPIKILEGALGGKKSPPKNEFTEYLKNCGPDLTPEQIEEKKKEFGNRDEEAMEEARKKLQAAIPDHMKLPLKQKELSPYEQAIQDEERKKAAAIEMQKKQQAQAVPAPSGKQARGSLFAKKKRPQSNAFEQSKNTKVG